MNLSITDPGAIQRQIRLTDSMLSWLADGGKAAGCAAVSAARKAVLVRFFPGETPLWFLRFRDKHIMVEGGAREGHRQTRTEFPVLLALPPSTGSGAGELLAARACFAFIPPFKSGAIFCRAMATERSTTSAIRSHLLPRNIYKMEHNTNN